MCVKKFQRIIANMNVKIPKHVSWSVPWDGMLRRQFNIDIIFY